MAVINLIGDTFADADQLSNAAALRDLTAALAATAPRACAVQVITPRGATVTENSNPRVSYAQIPLLNNSLSLLWQTSAAAKPIDGEMVHAITPLVPLLSKQKRSAGTQATVAVPHLAALSENSVLTAQQAKQQKQFLKRAVKHADVLIAPNFDVAARLQAEFGATNVRVVTNAAPAEFKPTADSASRRKELRLPDSYLVTTKPCPAERLVWLEKLVTENSQLPPLVIIEQLSREATDESPAEISAKSDRIMRVQPAALSDYGAILSGAEALLLPHFELTMAYEVYGAISAGVPVLHAEIPAAAEIAVDGAATFSDYDGLSELLKSYFDADGKTLALEQLQVLASDRSRVYTWETTAETLWEIHASL